MLAILADHEDVAQRLLQVGYKSSFPFNATDNFGYNCLMMSAKVGNLNTTKALIQCGVNINTQSRGGATALILASARGFSTMVDSLLSHPEIQVNIRSKVSLENRL